eukprot:2829266-Ditylum_brightwellii.AAC.1
MGPGQGITTTISLILPGRLISIHSEDFKKYIYRGCGEEHDTLSDIVTLDSADSKLRKSAKSCQPSLLTCIPSLRCIHPIFHFYSHNKPRKKTGLSTNNILLQ